MDLDVIKMVMFGQVREKQLNVLIPNNELIGQLIVPELVSNLEFGGKNGNILYVTATTSLYSLELNQQGAKFK
tara:strand:+ start:118 stop:336 length:219 start_codon:yes stop_codon:yes gene_type:complete